MSPDIVWEALRWPAVEHVAIDSDALGWVADGAMVAFVDGRPVRLGYRLAVDGDGTTRALELAETVGGASLVLRGDGRGHWHDAEGADLRELDGCVDVDISTTPLTNTLPIRRLRLAPGESAEINVGYVDVPSLVVRPVTQRYTRIDGRTYRYSSGSFAADVVFDENDLVTDYVGLWHRVSIAASR